MTPIQQMFLGVGAKKKMYMDDVFSTYLYKGNATATARNNGIDLAGEGGMVWVKRRDASNGHRLTDTVRGVTKSLESNSSDAEATETDGIQSFNNNGFTVGSDADYNGINDQYASWSFRKAKGFFDVVGYTGNGSNRTIAHSLGCKPGLVIIKRTDASDYWNVLHRDIGIDNRLYLNFNSTVTSGSSGFWNATEPTSSVFSVGTDSGVNGNGGTYVAYLFAGGESTASTATSVEFDNSTIDRLTVSNSSGDFTFGTGDYTWECWIKWESDISSSWDILWHSNDSGSGEVFYPSIDSNSWNIGTASAFQIQAPYDFKIGQWYHIAASRASGTLRMFVNGTQVGSVSDSTDYSSTGGTAAFPSNRASSGNIKLSNLRVIKGTGLYTSSFRPLTEPLTDVTNTKLLCCQGSSVTSATVIPSGASLTTMSDPVHSTDSPFDDPAAFKFGENGDQGIVKCGSYRGDGTTNQEVHFGFEPQWLIVKRTDVAKDWYIWDTMRGIVTGGSQDREFQANLTTSEVATEKIELSPTGFIVKSASSTLNADGGNFVYMALRRPDGYCGKPAEAGTDVFAMDTGNSSTTIPVYDSGFPVDFAMSREPGDTDNWWSSARILGDKYGATDTTNAWGGWSNYVAFDSNTGWGKYDNPYGNSDFQSWMWKRHAGFDFIAYKGDGVAGHQIPHSLSKTPEMMWVKNTSTSSKNWQVYHKGMNGGTNPEQYRMRLNSDIIASTNTGWNNTAPTSTHFTVGSHSETNGTVDDTYIALLFASVDGISKCGFYNGSDSNQTITTGFQPRFVIIKKENGAGDWWVLDTTRGWGSGNDKHMQLNNSSADASYDFGAPTSTGFTLTVTDGYNASGGKYIYYAHA